MVFRLVTNLVVPIVMGTSFIDRFFESILQPEHKIMLYSSALVPIIAPVIETKQKKDQQKQKENVVESVTVAEEAVNAAPLIRVARQTTIQAMLEAAVLVAREAKGLV